MSQGCPSRRSIALAPLLGCDGGVWGVQYFGHNGAKSHCGYQLCGNMGGVLASMQVGKKLPQQATVSTGILAPTQQLPELDRRVFEIC